MSTPTISEGGDRPQPGRAELTRKTIHILASVAAAAVALEAPARLVPWLFFGTFLVAVAIEEARRRSAAVGRVFDCAFGEMLRPKERRGTTGATTLAAGFAIATIMLPNPYAAIGIAVGGVSDAAAAVVGQFFGRHRIRSGKSLEGALACLATAFAIAWAMPGIGIAPAVVTAVIVAALELVPVPFDDNLWLAPVAGLIALASATPLA